jgi:hypothetical protein
LSQDEHPELKSRGVLSELHTFHTGREQTSTALRYSQSSARPNLDRWLDMKSVSLRSGASKASLASREQFMPSSVLSTPSCPLTTRTHHNTNNTPIIVHDPISQIFANLQPTQSPSSCHPASTLHASHTACISASTPCGSRHHMKYCTSAGYFIESSRFNR